VPMLHREVLLSDDSGTWHQPTGFLQCFDAVGWVIWPVKIVTEMTYKVSSCILGHYSLTQPFWLKVFLPVIFVQQFFLCITRFLVNIVCLVFVFNIVVSLSLVPW